MSDDEELQGTLFGDEPPEPPEAVSTNGNGVIVGRYFGPDPTDTERESGTVVEADRRGPLRPGSAGHTVLRQFSHGLRLTAYDASRRCSEDWHSKRREATRLMERGFLRKNGTLPNRAPSGRRHVDAYEITETGREELRRLADDGA